MKKYRFLSAWLLLLVLLSGHGRCWAETITLEEAINQAGRQRMLTQRMVKAYAMIGQRVSIGRGYDQLDAAIALFDNQLQTLKTIAATPEEKASLNKVARLWRRFKRKLDGKPRKSEVASLDRLAEAVLTEADHFVGLLEKRSSKHAGHLTNLSGRQRMLTQRMAKYYLFLSWGLDQPAYRQAFDEAVEQFQNSLNELQNSTENTARIGSELDQVEQQWGLFGLSRLVGKNRYVPSLVVRSLDNILQRMDHITSLYAKLDR